MSLLAQHLGVKDLAQWGLSPEFLTAIAQGILSTDEVL